MTQLDWLSGPRAHRRDPISSHEAARAAQRTHATHCDIVLEALKRWPGSTSAELARAGGTGFDLTEVRRRLDDLKRAGRVERRDPTGDTVPCALSGKRVCRWHLA